MLTVTLFYQEIRCVVYNKTFLAENMKIFHFLNCSGLHFLFSESVLQFDSIIRIYTLSVVHSVFYTLKYSAKGWNVVTIIWGCISEDDVGFFVPQQ
jgi:hypothetical protein